MKKLVFSLVLVSGLFGEDIYKCAEHVTKYNSIQEEILVHIKSKGFVEITPFMDRLDSAIYGVVSDCPFKTRTEFYKGHMSMSKMLRDKL